MFKLLAVLCLFITAALAQPGPRITVGPESPAASLCQSIQVGNIHVQTQDPANGPVQVMRCTQTGSLSYAWQPISHLVVTTLPAKCSVGDLAFKSDAGAGSNIYGCTTANTWTAQAGGGAGTGTVTTVGFTGGLFSIATPTTTPAITVAGTSGGVPYFSSASTWASSGALTANLPVIGGGAGSAPAVGTRSGNTTAFVTTSGTQTSGRCVEIDASGNHIASAAGCASGAGTVSVVGSGSLTSTALVTGGGTTTLQTAAVTATMDSSGNVSTPGTVTAAGFTTAGGSTAGYHAMPQGTANTPPANSVGYQAPTSVPSAYLITLPSAPAAGFVKRTNATPSVESVTTITLPFGCAVGDPAGSALSTGVLCYITVPMAGTITGWDIIVDAGTATVDVLKIATGTAKPTASIAASALPAISTGTAIHSTTLTSWTTSVAANDMLGFNLTAVGTAKYITVNVQVAF